jgi:hypothetical protein
VKRETANVNGSRILRFVYDLAAPKLKPIADCRLPIADCRLPIADCRLPIADCRSRFIPPQAGPFYAH